jgi:hypothetical protein
MKQIAEEILVPIGINVIQQILTILNAGIHPSHSKQSIDGLCQLLANEANKVIQSKSAQSEAPPEAPKEEQN